jgi:6-phosphogluconolactonase
VLPDAVALARAAVDAWRAAAAEGVRARGRFAVAISGGKTPLPAYALLAREPGLPWAETDVFFADERCVPPGDPRSNYGAARAALLGHVPARVHRIVGEREPEEAARAYEAELRATLGERPALDLVLLGVGDDGHTASLFPGSPALDERARLVLATPAPPGALAAWRVTLGLAALDGARRACFLVEGEGKRAPLARILAGEDLPAARVRAAEVRWLVTRDALP